jgi:hypothetical protein
MKKILNLLAVIALCLVLFPTKNLAQKPGYQIIVHVPSLKDSACYLANYYGDKQYIQDTVKSDANGIVVFEGKDRLPGGIYLFVFPDKRYFEIIVDKEQYFSLETSWNDPIHDMKVKGSKDNELFYEYLKYAVDLQKSSVEMQEKLKNAKSKSDSTAAIAQLRGNDEKMNDFRQKYITEHPESFLAVVFKTMPEPEVPKEIPTLSNGRKDSTFAYHYFKDQKVHR